MDNIKSTENGAELTHISWECNYNPDTVAYVIASIIKDGLLNDTEEQARKIRDETVASGFKTKIFKVTITAKIEEVVS